MPPDEAQVWLKKCIDSGLWVPGPSDEEAPAQEEPTEEESLYQELPQDTEKCNFLIKL